MYRPSQQPREPSQLARLSLAKFSHTTTSINHNGPLNWSHIIGNGDIIGVLEKYPASFSLPERVLLKVFRDYELLEEVDLAFHIREIANSALLGQNNQTKPIFAVIVKLPCLAVKYPRDGTSIRRFQIKFSSDRDYYTTLAILSSINCPLSESNVSSLPPIRKPTATHWRSGRALSSVPGTLEAFYSPSLTTDSSGISSTTIGIFPASCNPPRQAHYKQSTLTGSLLRPPSSSTTHTVTNCPTPIDNNQGPHLNMGPPQPVLQLDSDTLDQINTQLASSRPPTACHDPQTLNQLLPPKRDLPFLKPAAKKPRTSRKQTNKTSVEQNGIDTEQAQQSIQAQLPLPPPDPKPNKGINHSLTSLPQLYTGQEVPANAPNLPPPPVQQNTQTNTNTSFQPILPSATVQPQAAVSNNTLPIIQQPSNHPSSSAITTTNPNVRDNASSTQLQHHQLQQQSDIITDLTSYIAAPTTERITRLENWICEHIQDDDFLRLCQDVEGVWKRVAFGS